MLAGAVGSQLQELYLFGIFSPVDCDGSSVDTLVEINDPTDTELLVEPFCLQPHFRGQTASVRFLAFSNWATFDGNRFGNLRQLHIMRSIIGWTPEASQELLDALNANPQLEYLAISDGAVPAFRLPFALPEARRKAHLPSLREVVLFNENDCWQVSYAIKFLQYIRCPEQVAVSLSFQPGYVRPAGFIRDLHWFFEGKIRPPGLASVNFMSVEFREGLFDLLCLGQSAFYAESCSWEKHWGPRCLLKTVSASANLRIKFSSDKTISDGTDDLLMWLARHNFKELIIDATDQHPRTRYRVGWFLRWLSEALSSKIFPALATLHIQGRNLAIKPLADTFKRLLAVGRAPIAVHFHFQGERRKLDAKQQREFDDWKAQVIEQLRDRVFFHEKSRPIVTLPQVCTAPKDWK